MAHISQFELNDLLESSDFGIDPDLPLSIIGRVLSKSSISISIEKKPLKEDDVSSVVAHLCDILTSLDDNIILDLTICEAISNFAIDRIVKLSTECKSKKKRLLLIASKTVKEAISGREDKAAVELCQNISHGLDLLDSL